MENFSNDLIKFIREVYASDDFIPLHAPQLDERDQEQILDVVRSGYISTVGETTKTFEINFADYCDTKYAIATSSGTAALHMALLALGIGNNDAVLTQSLTFIATANAIKYCGAEPLFIDSDLDTLGMCPVSLESFIDENTHLRDDGFIYHTPTGKKISVCIPMHNLGHACELSKIKTICDKYNISILEDSAEALGSRILKQGRLGTLGEVGIFSFNGNKIISTGAGGMIVTNSSELANKAKHLSTTAKLAHVWKYKHDDVGYNTRMPALNAALGISQLKKLDYFLSTKRNLASGYSDWFARKGIKFSLEPHGTLSNYWVNSFFVQNKEERDAILDFTNQNGVMTRSAWNPLTNMKPYEKSYHNNMVNSQNIYDRLICIPSSPPKT